MLRASYQHLRSAGGGAVIDSGADTYTVTTTINSGIVSDLTLAATGPIGRGAISDGGALSMTATAQSRLPMRSNVISGAGKLATDWDGRHLDQRRQHLSSGTLAVGNGGAPDAYTVALSGNELARYSK